MSLRDGSSRLSSLSAYTFVDAVKRITCVCVCVQNTLLKMVAQQCVNIGTIPKFTELYTDYFTDMSQ